MRLRPTLRLLAALLAGGGWLSPLQAADGIDAGFRQYQASPPLLRSLPPPAAGTPERPRSMGDAQLFAEHAGSVVLILGKSSLGSGAIVSPDGLILTNHHVVSEGSDYAVVFYRPDGRIDLAPRQTARLVKVDQIADLALLRLDTPPDDLKPLRFAGPDDLKVGIDVHAIGHPKGQTWSYTKGQISQIRPDFTWAGAHRAQVIQTQTPLLPGNSGGPLLTDDGLILGINAFIDPKAASLNFAIGIDEVQRFLARPDNRYLPQAAAQAPQAAPAPAVATPPPRPAPSNCEVRILGTLRDTARNAKVVRVDLDCDGEPDLFLVYPDDRRAPHEAWLDLNKDKRVDVIVFDDNRDERWDRSFHDKDFDGRWDFIGQHPDGKVFPTRLVPFTQPQ